MNTIIEYIILAVAVALALFYIIRMIVKIAKGESPCFCCKSCDEEEKPSCCTPDEKKSSCCAPDEEKSEKSDKS